MKKLSILVVLTSLLLVSCIKDYAVKTEFIIKNETTHYITIEIKNFTNNSGYVYDTDFFLYSYSQWVNLYHSTKSLYANPFGTYADTVILYFDQTDTIIYTLLDKSDRNILCIDNFQGGEIRKHSYQYTYTINEADYQEAKK